MDFELVESETYECAAEISPCGQYRHALSRAWSHLPRLYFVMLNPSKADARKDDPTVRKCVGFAKLNGFGSIGIVNVSPYRATDPRELLLLSRLDLIGDRESADRPFLKIPQDATVVAAWGMFPYKHNLLGARILEVTKLLPKKLFCVKQSLGRPWHPLYVSYSPLQALKPA